MHYYSLELVTAKFRQDVHHKIYCCIDSIIIALVMSVHWCIHYVIVPKTRVETVILYPVFLYHSGSEREAELNMMQIVFTGSPRVGKSSFWKRLQGIIPKRLLPSTDITSSEGSVRLDIRGSCGFMIHVSELGWKKLQAEDEIEGFVSLVTQQGNPFQRDMDLLTEGSEISTAQMNQPSATSRSQDGPQTPRQAPDYSSQTKESGENVHEGSTNNIVQEENDISVGGSSNRELDSNKVVGVHSDVQIPSASAVLHQALINLRQTELSNRIDSASFVLCTDTGGQPEYQEFLSLLIAASNAVFIILNLEHDLHSYQLLEYLPSVNDAPVTYESPYTVGEMLCQSLISVPIHSSCQGASPKDGSGTEEILNRSCVFFIGTHKDKVSHERIDAMNRDLIELIQDTPQYKANIVQRCNAESLIFAVDNFSSLENDEDFVVIRRATQGLLYGSRLRVKAPTSWLFTGLVLQKLSETQTMISYDQCQEIARQCGIEQNSFKACVQFLHHTTGAIRHYESDHLQNVVIIKPQVVINALSHLFKRAFVKPLSRKAVITDEDINDATGQFKSVTTDRLTEIALDLLVMCRHPNSTTEHPMYYLTCMLPFNKENASLDDNASVYFMMEGFVFPLGLGRATITAIVQQRLDSKSPWKINYNTLCRNSIEFTVKSITFNIVCTTKHLRLSARNSRSASRETCSDVRVAIESIMSDVLKLYNYGQAKSPIVGFVCPSCDMSSGSSHYATLVSEDRITCHETRQRFEVPSHIEQWVLVSNYFLSYARKIFKGDAFV